MLRSEVVNISGASKAWLRRSFICSSYVHTPVGAQARKPHLTIIIFELSNTQQDPTVEQLWRKSGKSGLTVPPQNRREKRHRASKLESSSAKKGT